MIYVKDLIVNTVRGVIFPMIVDLIWKPPAAAARQPPASQAPPPPSSSEKDEGREKRSVHDMD